MSSVRLSVPKGNKGFTLIELLVAISIIAILSVVGFTSFTNVQKGAKDAKRKADIDAIAKAYEVKYNNDQAEYMPLTTSSFTSGNTPSDPTSSHGNYFNWLANDGSGFKVCAALDANSGTECNTPAANCYCKGSTQGMLNPSSSYYTPPSPAPSGIVDYSISATHTDLGPGSTSPAPSCDPDGRLFPEVGYWKMDEENWSGSGAVKDSSFMGNHGTAFGEAAIDTTDPDHNSSSNFKNVGSFDGIDDYVKVEHNDSLNVGTGDFTIAFWVKPGDIRPSSEGGGTPNQYILAKGGVDTDCVSGSRGLGLRINYVGKVQLKLNTGSTQGCYSQLNSLNALTELEWTHVAAVADRDGNGTIYLNGQEDNAFTLSGHSNTLNNTGNFYIGSRDPTTAPYKGKIDDVRIYKRALSGSEISNLYNSGSGCIP